MSTLANALQPAALVGIARLLADRTDKKSSLAYQHGEQWALGRASWLQLDLLRAWHSNYRPGPGPKPVLAYEVVSAVNPDCRPNDVADAAHTMFQPEDGPLPALSNTYILIWVSGAVDVLVAAASEVS